MFIYFILRSTSRSGLGLIACSNLLVARKYNLCCNLRYIRLDLHSVNYFRHLFNMNHILQRSNSNSSPVAVRLESHSQNDAASPILHHTADLVDQESQDSINSPEKCGLIIKTDLKRDIDESITIDESVKRIKSDHAEDEDKNASAESSNLDTLQPVLKKNKKHCIIMSFSGKGYYGMQYTKSESNQFPTIEGELLEALNKAELIHSFDIEEGLKNYQLQKMSFQRGSRTDKSVSAIGQFVSLKMGISDDPVKTLNELLPPQIRVWDVVRVTQGFDAKMKADARTYSYLTPTFGFSSCELLVDESFRLTEDNLARIREVLERYVGSKNYHNFTSGKRADDPSARRHIISFTCGTPFIHEGIEFIALKVKGQSFMLHQIRKMIAVAMAVVRGLAQDDILEKAFDLAKLDIPKAPGLGLMLNQIHYDNYNKRYSKTHQTLDIDRFSLELESFKFEHIYKDILKAEKVQKSMARWLSTLFYHSYAEMDVKRPYRSSWLMTLQSKAAAVGSVNAGGDVAADQAAVVVDGHGDVSVDEPVSVSGEDGAKTDSVASTEIGNL